MNILKPILFLLMLQAAAYTCSAIHIKGGWMYYEYLGKGANGNNRYRLVVKFYRDCATPTMGQNDMTINISIYRGDNNSFFGNFRANRTSLDTLEKKTFSECINPKPQVCYVILEYTATISLPPNTAGYTAAFQRCCRINGIVNVQPPSNTYGNTYTIKFPGTQTPTAGENSSPKFAVKDTVAVCYHSPIELDYSATDIDGDSLVYSFTNALSGGSQTVPAPTQAAAPPYSSLPYSQSYSSTNPFGTNVVINPATGIITGISPGITGEYVLAVTIKEYRGGVYIAETRKELHVNVAACNISAAELPLRIITCDGYTVQFENLSMSSAINSYYWDFGVTTISTDTSTLPIPTYTYADTGVYTAKLVVNKNSNCVDSATTQIRVFPGFFPDFTYSGSCFLNPFQFRDISSTRYGTINAWKWNFGDPGTAADTSLTKNPTYQYPIGTYTVLLVVASDRGCSDTVLKQIVVTDKPFLKVAFPDTLICSIDSLLLRANGSGTFSWTPDSRIINANTATPTVFPLQTTTYQVQLLDRGCVATDKIRVNVLDFITVNAGPDTTICRRDSIRLNPVSQGLQYKWIPATGLSDDAIKNPLAFPVNPTNTYTVIVNLGKCQSQDAIIIKTIPYPIADAGADTSICSNDTAMLKGSGNGSSYSWTPSGSVQFPTQLITPAYPSQTTTYILSSFANLGCPKPGLDKVLVTVRPVISVFAGRDTSIVIGQPLQLNSESSNGSIYNWTPPTGINNPAIPNPVIVLNANSIPEGADKIRYVLTVSTDIGCSVSDDIVVSLFKTFPSIFMPNAFTPNQDGKNDDIKPILAGVRELLYFRVYNRYGQLVFETKQQGKGWDGRFKGETQGSNAFVYSCQAIDYTGKTLTQNGSFVLIR